MIGAIYLDYGYEKCGEFIRQRLFVSFDILKKTAEGDENYKSKLLEWTQKNRLEAEFRIDADTVDAYNQHTFRTQLLIEGIVVSEGVGASKKESQQHASAAAFQLINNSPGFVDKITDKANHNVTTN